jgi:hypothetical protein
MAAPYATLLLDNTNWDLCLDSNGDIALTTWPYALAQDVASAIKTFLGEVYYNTTIGVPYFQKILGKRPSLAVFQALMVQAALTVPGVVSATCVIESFTNRQIMGQVQFTDIEGQTGTVVLVSGTFGSIPVLATLGGSPITIGGQYIEV